MINWKNVPFIRLVIFLITGILLGIYCKVDINYWMFISLFCLGSLTITYFLSFIKISRSKEFIFGWLLHSSIVIFGISLIAFKTANNAHTHYSNFQNETSSFQIEVIEAPKTKSNSLQVIAEIKKVQNDSINFHSSGHVLLYFELDSNSNNILQGDILFIKCSLNEIAKIKNPGQFNYKEYLRFNQIYHQGFVSKSNWIIINSNLWSLTGTASILRNKLLKTLKKNGLQKNELSVASALILGYKEDLETDLKHSYSSAGATHVLAVSGLHVGIIFLVLNTLLNFMDEQKNLKFIKLFLILIILWIYAFMTGLSPSVIRATTMFSFIASGNIINRKSSIYNTLAASAFVLLCYNPFLIMEVGFQLSYLAVLGIVYFQPKIYSRLYFKNWLLDRIWSITAVSIAAQLTTFPLGLLYFHQFPTYFMISNLFVIPGAFVIILVGIVLFITSWIPAISALFAKLLFTLIFSMNWLVESIDKLPISLIEGISITVLECWLLYGTLLFFIGALEFRKLKYLNFGLILIIILFSVDFNEDYELNKRKEISIFHIKNQPNINFIAPGKNVFYCSETLYNDYSSMLFNVKHHWDDIDAQIVTHKPLTNLQTFSFHPYLLTYISSSDSLIKMYGSDIVYTESSHLPLELECKILIIGSSVSFSSQKKLEEFALTNNIKVHNIKKEGAFVLNNLNEDDILK